jgi:hypothetical protein
MKKLFLLTILALCSLALLFDFYQPMRKFALPLPFPFNNPAWLIEFIAIGIILVFFTRIKPNAIPIIFTVTLLVFILEFAWNVKAWGYLTTLNDSSSAKNLTFTTSENQTVWVRLPKNVRVIDAKLNLSGYYGNEETDGYSTTGNAMVSFNITTNASFYDGFAQNFTLSNTGWVYQVKIAFRGNDSTTSISQSNAVINVTIRDSVDGTVYAQTGEVNLTALNCPNAGDGTQTCNLPIDDTKLNSGDYYLQMEIISLDYPFRIFGTCSAVGDQYTSGIWQVHNTTGWLTDFLGTYYGAESGADCVGTDNDLIFTVSYKRYPNSPYLDVSSDGDIEWSYTGEFNQSVSPERTNNFSQEITDYLSTCPEDPCDVPLILHSDTAGKLEISDINITYGSPKWSNNQSSIITPYTTETSIFNITWEDDPGYTIDTVFIEGNWSGSPQNYSMFLLEGTTQSGVWSYNETLPAGTFYWKSYANASDGVWNSTDKWEFTVTKGSTNLRYTNAGSNSSSYSTGDYALFHTLWYLLENTQANLSHYIFSWNALDSDGDGVSDSWINFTWTPFSETNNSWSNITKQIPKQSEGQTINWKVYANSSAGSNFTACSNISSGSFTVTNQDPTISSVTYSPDCIEEGGGVTWSWTQSDNNNISTSYCNFTNPLGTVTKTDSTLTNNIGTASCSDPVDFAGPWYVKIYIEDPAGNSKSILYYFEVKEPGGCGPVGGGGGAGAPEPKKVYVCPEGQIYDTELEKCVPLPVELLEEKPMIYKLEHEFLKPRFKIPGTNFGVSLFHVTISATAVAYVEHFKPTIFTLRKKRK